MTDNGPRDLAAYVTLEAGDSLPEACNNGMHGHLRWMPFEFDPQCGTCTTRKALGEHNHLHLNGEECETPGLNGAPGVMVRCRCGGFHH